MSEELKAIEEVAKTIGKGIEAGTGFFAFVSRFISGPLEQKVGMYQDKLTYTRWENQIKLMMKAEKFRDECGLNLQPTKLIPLKFAVPLFQAATLEDDDYLQDLWAKLLINSSYVGSGIDLNRTCIDILERLSPLEAKILMKIYDLPFEKIEHRGVLTTRLPEEATPVKENFNKKNIIGDNKLESEPIILALSNLSRLGCIFQGGVFANDRIFEIAIPTILGKYLAKSYSINF